MWSRLSLHIFRSAKLLMARLVPRCNGAVLSLTRIDQKRTQLIDFLQTQKAEL